MESPILGALQPDVALVASIYSEHELHTRRGDRYSAPFMATSLEDDASDGTYTLTGQEVSSISAFWRHPQPARQIDSDTQRAVRTCSAAPRRGDCGGVGSIG